MSMRNLLFAGGTTCTNWLPTSWVLGPKAARICTVGFGFHSSDTWTCVCHTDIYTHKCTYLYINII